MDRTLMSPSSCCIAIAAVATHRLPSSDPMDPRRISPSPPSVLHLRAGDPRPRNSGRPLPRPLPRLHRASEGSARVDRAPRPSDPSGLNSYTDLGQGPM